MTLNRINSNSSDLSLRIGATLALPSIVRDLGLDPAEVLSEIGIDISLFDDPNNRISYMSRGNILAHCVSRTGCPHLGLLIGQQSGLHSLGLLGLLVKYSPNVEIALRNLVRYLFLHVSGAVSRLEVYDKFAMLSYESYQPGVKAVDQTADGAVASIYNIMRSLCGPSWSPTEVQFMHAQPENIAPYRQFFNAPLRFNAENNAVVFSKHWLYSMLFDNDPELNKLLQKHIDSLELIYADDLAGKISSVLRSTLLSDQSDAEHIASIFSMHSRTMNRKLNKLGTNFQTLVDSGRFEIARQMLENSSKTISQIAEVLRYTDASAFTRAFRRWSGVSPKKWRESFTSHA